MSFWKRIPRGMRAIVSRNKLSGSEVSLTLECGHVVVRSHHSVQQTSAICPDCKRADGAKRDAAMGRP